MKSLLAITLATVYGLSLRIMFGFLNGFMGIMSVSFLIIIPVLIGYLTIIFIPRYKVRNLSTAFFKPWLTGFAILLITILLKVEGMICWIMIYPLFSILAGIGGMMAYTLRKPQIAKKDEPDKPNTLKISFLLLIPLLTGFAEGDRSLSRQDFILSRTVEIDAPASVVWSELTSRELRVAKSNTSFAHIMGFPRHIKTVLDTIAVGGRRIAYYEKGLYFEESISYFQPEEILVLNIKTDPDKIPPTVMDEHIIIGGKHVDVLQDTYRIEKLSDSNCRLILSSKFYINTPFNWYASIWAKVLMNDILQGQLDLVASRSELK